MESQVSNHFDRLATESFMGRLTHIKQVYRSIPENYVGYFLLTFAQACNSIMITACKLLITDNEFDTKIHPIQILFVRMTITYLLCLAYMFITKSVPDAPFGRPEVRKWLILRGVLGFLGVFSMYFSLLYLSVSDAVAITFLIPLVTAFFAFVLLHERYSIIEGICSIISLSGVLMIAKPHFLFGQEADNESSVDESVESSSTEKRLLATAVGLLGTFGASLVYIVLRKLGKETHALLSVSYFGLAAAIVSLLSILVIPSIPFEFPHNKYQWLLLVAIGITGFIYQISLTAGVQRVKASEAALVVYTQMIFAILWDVIIWHHLPGILSVLGIIIIMACTFIVIRYKPTEKNGDLEHQSVPLVDESSYKPEAIALRDFVIESDNEQDLELELELDDDENADYVDETNHVNDLK